MPPEFDLTDQPFSTSFAPLCALGDALWERGELDSLRQFSAILAKSCIHTPGEKLLDAFLVILAGYPSLYLLNTALRPDPILAQAWHRRHLGRSIVGFAHVGCVHARRPDSAACGQRRFLAHPQPIGAA